MATRKPAHYLSVLDDRIGPHLSMQIQLGDGVDALPVGRPQLRRWAKAALERDAELTLRFVSAAEGRALNREYRGQDHATNVLTFAYPSDPVHGNVHEKSVCPSPVQADILICMTVVAAEAAEQNKMLIHHLAHLVMHGTLHAQGWDHEEEEQAQNMEALETQLLARFGISDPYCRLGANS
jgi:probable rRNA maturation factor